MSWQKKIKAARERLGMKKSELADEIGVSPAAITLWEQETEGTKNIDGANLVKAAKVLKVTAEWIMGDDDELPPLEVTEPERQLQLARRDELRELLASATDEVRLLAVHRLADPENRKVIDNAVADVIDDLDLATLLDKRKTGTGRP
jgi:transcriptional regulator with XRE-family HTH domain